MATIKILDDNLANQIAAGEVVERPASVIKELIENSIDAGASRINVDVEIGGRRLMRITDNGEGMERDDAILAFERHATSKIRSLDDLARIGTLGFRGEALASIASVAKVELVTKIENEIAATRVAIEGGRLMDVKDAARDTGTSITVTDLFYNTPARRKFMRSEATENYHIASIVSHYALAHPEIAFRLTNNGREALSAPVSKDLRERAFQLFGGSLLESLLPVDGGREFVAAVTGFVSAPRERRTNRDSQYFFVNNRYVRDKAIAAGLLEGYRSVLPHGVFPVAFLFINVPVEEIDVNVHPAKTEIRFRRTEAVKDVIAEAVRQALSSAGIGKAVEEDLGLGREEPEAAAGLAPPASLDHSYSEQAKISFPSVQDEDRAHDRPFAVSQPAETDRTPDMADPGMKDQHSEQDTIAEFTTTLERAAQARSAAAAGTSNGAPLGYSILPPVDSAERFLKPADASAISGSKVRPISQLHESFIIAADDEGLLLIDQHVAHERILFDKFRKKESERPIESQNLLLPETIDLTPAQVQAFQVVETELADLGFGVMKLSGRTIAVKSIPTDLPPSEIRNLLAEILDNVELEKRGDAKSSMRAQIAASLACKAAVKINMPLTPEKMNWLIERLLTTSSPTTCPHGRPVILRLSMKDIERGFHRT